MCEQLFATFDWLQTPFQILSLQEQWFSLTDEPHNIPRQPFAPYPDEIITFVNEVGIFFFW